MQSDRWRRPLGALFLVSGSLHFLRPDPFASIVPPILGPALPWVWASGAAELLCAAGLLAPGSRRRSTAAYASAVLLVVVFPANLWMAWEAWRDVDATGLARAVATARLPLQVPLVLAAVSVGREQAARQRLANRPASRTDG